MKKVLGILLLLMMGLSALSCALPRHLWNEEDMADGQWNSPLAETRILVASRKSPFKNALVEKIVAAFSGEGFYLKIIGIGHLEGETATDYSAVVLLHSCIAWGVDPQVEAFLKRMRRQKNVILLTTSAAGNWSPDLGGMTVDAVSSASIKAKVDSVARRVIEKIQNLLSEKKGTLQV